MTSTPGDPVLQIYTSGTSGQPKGVLLTNANLAEKVRRMVEIWRFTAFSRSLLATPLFHIGGLSWGLIGLAARAVTYLPQRASDAGLLDSVMTDRITHAFLVPKMLLDVTDAADGEGLRSTPLEVLVCGGAPVTEDLQLRAMRFLGCSVFQVYGMTETTGAIVQLDAAQAAAATEGSSLLRSCGVPYPWVDVAIRDPSTCQLVPYGVPGEIWTRSAQNCAGYWNRPSETSELLTDGWLRTGDGGYLDEHGHLHLTDRIKDMIISGGENIYSAEVEQALLDHPLIVEAAAFGLPDDEWGEIVVAAVVPAAGKHIDTTQVADYVGEALGRYKRPRRLVIRDALPRNASGKVLKRELQQELASATHRRKERMQ